MYRFLPLLSLVIVAYASQNALDWAGYRRNATPRRCELVEKFPRGNADCQSVGSWTLKRRLA
jgi:hypothetical protein